MAITQDLPHRNAAGAAPLDRRAMMRAGGGLLTLLMLGACGGGGGGSNGVTVVPTGSGTPVPAPTPTPTATPAPTPVPDATSSVSTQFGVNYYDLFHRFITYAAPFDPETQLRPLADRGLKIVRFAACPLWARDWTLWYANPERYLAALDRIFDAGDKFGMKLVPVLMSAPFGLSDYCGEPFPAWGNPASKTRKAFDAFIPMMVDRFRTRSSLLMWEFANEMNAFASVANGYTFYPPADTAAGIGRTIADNYTTADYQSAYGRFAELVRSRDMAHPVESGSTMPKNTQINNTRGLTTLDSRSDLMTALQQTMAGGNEVLSVHLYDDITLDRFDRTGSTFAELIGMARSAATRGGNKLFLGEFGVPASGDTNADRTRFRAMLQEVKAAKVDYAAVWAYDAQYSPTHNFTTTNDRSWILDELVAAQAA